jgi:hypothetical protein
MKGGKLPYLRLGAFDLPEVPVVHGQGFTDIQAVTGMDILGAIGSGLLGLFRCTLTDGGRVLWVEDNDQVLQMLQQAPQAPPAGAPGGAPPASSGGAPPTLSAPTLLPPVPPAPAAPKP